MKITQQVIVTPKINDVFDQEFIGYIINIRNTVNEKLYTVVDQDNNSWDATIDQLKELKI